MNHRCEARTNPTGYVRVFFAKKEEGGTNMDFPEVFSKAIQELNQQSKEVVHKSQKNEPGTLSVLMLNKPAPYHIVRNVTLMQIITNGR